MNKKFDSDESGSGIIGALVAVGVLAAGSVAAMNILSNTAKVGRAVELKADANRIKKILLNSTDCSAIPACAGNELRSIFDFDGAVLVDADGKSRSGAWTVQARCQADQSIEVRVALLDTKGNAVKEPLRAKLIDWNSPDGILIEAGVLCGIIKDLSSTPYTVITSPQCVAGTGSCPVPPGRLTYAGAPANMCCEDGRDAVKPKCPAGTREYNAYWDRQDDWGMAGQWVVLCQ